MILSSGRLLYIFARVPFLECLHLFPCTSSPCCYCCCYCAQLLQIITTAEHNKYIDYVDKVVIIISVDALATLLVWLIDQRLLTIDCRMTRWIY